MLSEFPNKLVSDLIDEIMLRKMELTIQIRRDGLFYRVFCKHGKPFGRGIAVNCSGETCLSVADIAAKTIRDDLKRIEERYCTDENHPGLSVGSEEENKVYAH